MIAGCFAWNTSSKTNPYVARSLEYMSFVKHIVLWILTIIVNCTTHLIADINSDFSRPRPSIEDMITVPIPRRSV
jgi:hypothetical protein